MLFTSALILVSIYNIILCITARMCIPSHHIFVSNDETYTVFHRKNFHSSIRTSQHFQPLVLDEENNRLIIGAKDIIFFVNDTSLQPITNLTWNSDPEKNKRCFVSASRSSTIPEDSCANYIQYLAIYGNKLLMCGTNSLSPKYKLISLDTFNVITEKVDFDVCSSPNPNISMVAQLTEYGELISGTYKDFYKRHPVISSVYLTDNPPRAQLVTESGRKDFLENPEFISSVHVRDSVYIFFIEKAIENRDVPVATVVRLCTTDNGGSQMINENMWTTFRKSRLVCEIDKGVEIFNFQNLVDVTYDENQDVFYAVYTMFKINNMHSAICTFKRQDIDTSFDSRFLKIQGIERDASQVQSIDNGDFLVGCEVNPANKSRPGSTKLPPGKQPTNSLNTESLLKAKSYNLMEKKVFCQPDIFEFFKIGTTFSRLVLDPIWKKRTNIISSPLLNIVTESGSVLMVYKSKNFIEPYIVEEVSTDVTEVKRVLLNKEKGMLYISSEIKLIGLNIDNCGRYVSQQQCLDAHNPRCGWSTKSKQCISSWHVSDYASFKQDFSGFPKKTDYFTKWSEWKPCEYSPGRYCLCRHRSCSSCEESLCNNGEFVQAINCTANYVSNLNEWIKEGSQDGHWSEWLEWDDCNAGKCGNYTMSRIRTCTTPAPSNGGKKCIGDSFQCKTCLLKPEVVNIFWSGWSAWSGCTKEDTGYTMVRHRNCSKPLSCSGKSSEIQQCIPGGVKWGSWSICACMQRVQHRYPNFINGCVNCTLLKYPQYRVCIPNPVNCPTEKVKVETTTLKTAFIEMEKFESTTKHMTTTTPQTSIMNGKIEKTSKPTTPEFTTHVSTHEETVDSVEVITQFQSEESKGSFSHCDGQYTLAQVIIISCCIIVISFFISLMTICILLRRKKSEFKEHHHNGKSAKNPDNHCTELISKTDPVA